MGKWGTGKINRTCLCCQTQFKSRRDRIGKYCSKSCASKCKKHPSFLFYYICENCGKESVAKRYRKNIVRFCSIQCLAVVRGMSMRKEKHPKWKGGISSRSYEDRKLVELKKKEIGKCEICNSTENLEGHHINGYGNDKFSIQILCAKCHGDIHPNYKHFIGKKYERKKQLD